MSAASAPTLVRPDPLAVPHATDIQSLVSALQANLETGLSSDEVSKRLVAFGPNQLPQPPKKHPLLIFLEQFANPLVLTLLAAAVVAVVVGVTSSAASLLGRFGDSIAILLIVILNALLGYFQERRAEAALDALQKMTAPTARVVRNGHLLEVPAADLVPGDLLQLEAGDAVPADARLVQSVNLATEESMLTGESTPTAKDAEALGEEVSPISDRESMVFMATTVVRGKGRALVVCTGSKTELGRIGEMIQSAADEKTPLEQRLQGFGKRILWGCLAISVLLFGWGMVRHDPRGWSTLLLEAVSLAVAAIPEGLPAITTITLALGMQRMARHGAIVRKLPAVETLGAATIICSDKTGTLTQNEMTVREVWAGGMRYQVSGHGYDPSGAFALEPGKDLDESELAAPLLALLSTAALCNNASLEKDPASQQWKVLGDPTEGALLTLAAKGKLPRESLAGAHRVVGEVPFDSNRKRMTVITLDASGRRIAHVKGSTDVLLPRCVNYADADGIHPMDAQKQAKIIAEAERMSSEALRVLALARREGPGDDPEEGLTYLGLVGMIDPPRVGVKEAIETCRKAGVRAVMITGDHKLTAVAIAKELGLWQPDDEALTGSELQKLSDDELKARVMHIRVFARTTPEQKLRIVKAYKALGHVVAMTGDGVNDAPALREAHIGVAMGRSGTDVARQASDIVLADDNFATIVEAVREGRAIYHNIQKFIFFLLSANAGLVVAVFSVAFFTDWPALTPLMILWINLVTNGLPALALGVDPPDPNQMLEPPRRPSGGLLGPRDYTGIIVVGLVMGLMAVVLYAWAPDRAQGLVYARNAAFTLLALSPLMHAFSCRSTLNSLFSARPFLSPPLLVAVLISTGIHLLAVLVPQLQPVFKTHWMSGPEWLRVLLLSAAILPAMELTKAAVRLARRRRPVPPPTSTPSHPTALHAS